MRNIEREMTVSQVVAAPLPCYQISVAVHCGKPSMQKSEKFISLNKALDMGVTTELVGAWGGMKGNVIKS